MGTSQSSKGSPSGTPMVPPWVPPVPQNFEPNVDLPMEVVSPQAGAPQEPSPDQEQPSGDEQEVNQGEMATGPIPIAPRGRFNASRRHISDFAKTGSVNSLQKGLKHYAKKGVGGGKIAAKRLAGTSKTAGTLFHALSGLASQAQGQAPVLNKLDKNQLQGKPAREIINKIVEALSPTDGTQDSEARKRSIDNSLSDLLEKFPDADLCNLNVEQIEFSVEAFAIEDIIRRFELDLQQTILEKAPGVIEASKRVKEAKDFIREVAKDAFKSLKTKSGVFNEANVSRIISSAIELTFDVFGSYEE